MSLALLVNTVVFVVAIVAIATRRIQVRFPRSTADVEQASASSAALAEKILTSG